MKGREGRRQGGRMKGRMELIVRQKDLVMITQVN